MAYKRISPAPVVEGGTGAQTFTTHGVLLGQGTGAITATAEGSTGQVLTGVTGGNPVWASPASSSISLTGDTGGALTGTSFTIKADQAGLNCGSSVKISGSGTTLKLNVTDTSGNTIIGINAGATGSSGGHNTSVGTSCFALLSSGTRNTALGDSAANLITAGSSNIAIGYVALGAARNSDGDVAIGDGCLSSLATSAINGNVVIGANNCFSSLTSGAKNIGIGYNVGTAYTSSESSNILLNSSGVLGESNVLRIGAGTGSTAQKLAKAYICGIDGVNVGSVAKVVTMASDQLGTATITAGTGISVTPGANTITIAATGSGFTWSVITANQTAAVNNGYICNKAGTLALALPASSAVGDVIEVTGINTATGWQITQAAGQQIFFGTSSTTLGATGTLTSTNIRDSIRMVCVVANTTWNVISSIGDITVV